MLLFKCNVFWYRLGEIFYIYSLIPYGIYFHVEITRLFFSKYFRFINNLSFVGLKGFKRDLMGKYLVHTRSSPQNLEKKEERGMYLGLEYRWAVMTVNQKDQQEGHRLSAFCTFPDMGNLTWAYDFNLFRIKCHFKNLSNINISCPRKVCKYIQLCA